MILMNPTASALFSPCGRYRYELHRRWGTGPSALWVGCNPSKAGADTEDHTTRKIRRFTERLDCDAFALANVYPWIATDPNDLRVAARGGRDVLGNPDADRSLADLLESHRSERVIFAWGDALARVPGWRARIATIDHAARSLGIRPLCLGTAKSGQPRHPLMLPYATKLELWELPR